MTEYQRFTDDKYLNDQIVNDLTALAYHIEKLLKDVKSIMDGDTKKSYQKDLERLSSRLELASFDCNDIKKKLYGYEENG
jgi:hypothetical protein